MNAALQNNGGDTTPGDPGPQAPRSRMAVPVSPTRPRSPDPVTTDAHKHAPALEAQEEES